MTIQDLKVMLEIKVPCIEHMSLEMKLIWELIRIVEQQELNLQELQLKLKNHGHLDLQRF